MARLKINIQKRREKPGKEYVIEVTALGKRAQEEKNKTKRDTQLSIRQPYTQILVTVDLKFSCNRASAFYMATSQ